MFKFFKNLFSPKVKVFFLSCVESNSKGQDYYQKWAFYVHNEEELKHLLDKYIANSDMKAGRDYDYEKGGQFEKSAKVPRIERVETPEPFDFWGAGGFAADQYRLKDSKGKSYTHLLHGHIPVYEIFDEGNT